MPPKPLMDLESLDTEKFVVSHDEIYAVNPHRYEFALLDGLIKIDLEEGLMAACVEMKADDFWVRGHIPGRPLFPGVLMIESSAQMIGYFVKQQLNTDRFVGFGGVTDVKFRDQVTIGDKLLLVGEMIELRGLRRAVARTQGFVNGRMVYEGIITGVVL